MPVDFKNEAVMVAIDTITPSPWNPAKIDERRLIEDAKTNILRVGFIGAIFVRDMRTVSEWPTDWQIVDGEHRWQALRELEAVNCPVIDMGVMEDDQAKVETLNFNFIHGQMEALPVAILIKEQYDKRGEDLAVMLAKSREEIDHLVEMVKFDWDNFKYDPGEKDTRQLFVRHMFVLTIEQDEVICQALERMALISDLETESRALELLCADWLSGAPLPEGKELKKPLRRKSRVR